MRLFYWFTLFILPAATHASSPVWLIEKGTSKLYLGGTVHVLRAKDYPLPDAYEKAYANADQLVFEIDISEVASAEFQASMAQSMRLPEGTDLSQLLQEETLNALDERLLRNGLSLERLAGMKPVMIALTLTVVELQKFGAGQKGVDEFYFRKAAIDGKPVSGLETGAQQIEMLSEMGAGNEDMMMRYTLDELESLEQDFEAMLDAWRSGNREQLDALFVTPIKTEFSEIYQELLVNRNDHWLPQLVGLLETPETELVLVGSAHLAGQDGLLKRLESSGYNVTQLK